MYLAGRDGTTTKRIRSHLSAAREQVGKLQDNPFAALALDRFLTAAQSILIDDAQIPPDDPLEDFNEEPED
jgi:hypothetical protein